MTRGGRLRTCRAMFARDRKRDAGNPPRSEAGKPPGKPASEPERPAGLGIGPALSTPHLWEAVPRAPVRTGQVEP